MKDKKIKNKRNILFYIYSVLHSALFIFILIMLNNSPHIINQYPPFTLFPLSIAGLLIPFFLIFKSKITNFILYIILIITVFLGFFVSHSYAKDIKTTESIIRFVILAEESLELQIKFYKEKKIKDSINAEENELNSQIRFKKISNGVSDNLIETFLISPHGMSAYLYSDLIYSEKSHIENISDGEKYWTNMILFSILLQILLHLNKKGKSNFKELSAPLTFFGFSFFMIFIFISSCIFGVFLSLFSEVILETGIAGVFITIILIIQSRIYFNSDSKIVMILYYIIGIPLVIHLIATILSSLKSFGYISIIGGFNIENFGIIPTIIIGFIVFVIVKTIEFYEKHFKRK